MTSDDVSQPTEPRRAQGAMAQLDHDALVASQQQTLASPRRRYSIGARALFTMLDTVYGERRTLSKFKVLELIARVPYQAWEQVGYIAITHTYENPQFARDVFDRVTSSRDQEDNEQWHLLLLEEMIARDGVREGKLKFFWIPQLVAFVYYQLSWLLYVLRPTWSYRLNADFEDHAEHEYALLVQEHPEWEDVPFTSALADDYASVATVADLFRQIGYDERVHKDASVAAMGKPRF
jgi:hypothetical protein